MPSVELAAVTVLFLGECAFCNLALFGLSLLALSVAFRPLKRHPNLPLPLLPQISLG